MASFHQTNPRRRAFKATSPQMTPLSTHSLRKSGTFHSPTSASSDIDPVALAPFMPKRSQTSSEQLEDLISDAGVRRVVDILERFDATFSGKASTSAGTNLLNDPEVYPVPSFMLDRTTMESDPMDLDPTFSPVERHHASDSGLGSSIGSPKQEGRSTRSRRSMATTVATSHSAITKSFSALGSNEGEPQHALGEYACKAIHDQIIKPILAEESLKDFHPLISDVPRRIGTKNITNLRDLEKTLIFLAPEFSATPASYLRFCERSIQLLHATVGSLPEQDQRLPTDRPYTNNYFLDLVEQIRRYAAIMAATRQKQDAGEELDEMDYSPDEKITIRGGLSHDGRPAELVREKNGKVIPISEKSDEALISAFQSAKRGLEEEDMEDDGARRSMARRRKSEKPGDVSHVCKACDKEFKRPCDLTKHEKTHSRPWKCPEEKCKYHDLGWPTEKERDRHVNDRHSTAPAQYKCQFPPCTYASKRESNCKQHMEKAHNWTYVRSKSNGRKKSTGSSNQTPQTPLTPVIDTPLYALQNLPTPITPFAPSPAISYHDYDLYNLTPAMSTEAYHEDYRRNSVTTAGSVVTYSSGYSPNQPTSFEEAVTPEDTGMNHEVVLDPIHFPSTHFNTVNFQQPTPAMSTGYNNFSDFARPFPVNSNVDNAGIVPHLSPGAQVDVTLYSPTSGNVHMDEGFEDGFGAFGPPAGDFTLFDGNSNNGQASTVSDNWFEDLSNFGGQFDNMYANGMGSGFDDMLRGI